MENIIILMGMSGIGKSHHAARLHEKGYKMFGIDDQIAKSLGEGDVHDIASWLGHPYESRYEENSRKYLELENSFTRQAIEYAKSHRSEKIVIDTTGSLIHLPEETLRELSAFPSTIFLDTQDSAIDKMIDSYIHDPKPVIWGCFANSFTKENYMDALQKLYPQLLAQRRGLYGKYAKTTVPYASHKAKNWLESQEFFSQSND